MLQVFLISCDITHAHMLLHVHMQTHTHLQKHTDVHTHTHRLKPTQARLYETAHKLVKHCHLEICACENAPPL